VTVTVDINVLVDVFGNRQPHYAESARVVDLIVVSDLTGVCPAHGLTTLYYIVRKIISKEDAEAAMDRVLDHFEIGDLDAAGWREARALPFGDFEDAVVAAIARKTASAFIITRDLDGFAGSPVPAITPADFLGQFPAMP
jgi:predicted nucleic acid-binding protein